MPVFPFSFIASIRIELIGRSVKRSYMANWSSVSKNKKFLGRVLQSVVF